VYGGITSTKKTHDAWIGPPERSIEDKESVAVPVWAGVGATVVNGALLSVRSKAWSPLICAWIQPRRVYLRSQGPPERKSTMKRHHLHVLVPGTFVASALALAVGVGAQTTPPAETPPVVTEAPASPTGGHHHMDSAEKAARQADMKSECQAMMAKKQEMEDKLKAMDAELDKLVAEMNAAKGSNKADAMEKPMAAVINQLVAEQKACRSMMMEMQPAMMAHMMHHMEMMQGMEGAMKCPMMKTGDAPETETKEK